MSKTIKTKVIEIEYDNNSEQQAHYLEKLINKNYGIFADLFNGLSKISFLPFKNDQTLYIENIDDLKDCVNEMIPDYLENVIPAIMQETNNQAKSLYLKLLLLDNEKIVDRHYPTLTEDKEYEMYINSIYSLAAAIYCKEKNCPEDFTDIIFDLEDNKIRILSWLYKTASYELLNNLLEEQYQELTISSLEPDEKSQLLNSNLFEMLDLIQEDFNPDKYLNYRRLKYDVSPLTKDELDELCVEFFQKIDPSNTFLNLYNQIKYDRILTVKAKKDNLDNWFCTPSENGYIIVAPMTGTIRDFRSLIHEFTHFIEIHELPSIDMICPSLLEYGSLFMEKEAIKFLEEKKYPQTDIDALRIERQMWTESNTTFALLILQNIKEYLNNGPITSEHDHAIYESTIDDVYDLNSYILQNPNGLVNAYPYMISSYFVQKTKERLDEEPTLLPTILEITTNLVNETPESIITKLSLPITIKPSKEYIKSKKNS